MSKIGDMSTYGMAGPVKANVNMNLIKMIVSKSSQSLITNQKQPKPNSWQQQNSAIIL